MEQIIAAGMTANEWVNLLKGDQAVTARKAINYMDGAQEEELIKILNDPNSGRRNWRQKGFLPRYRNITKMVVEKSSMLYAQQMPMFELWDGTDLNETETQKLRDELDKIPLQEILNNADQALRLLKTIFLLYQYDSESKELVIDILHHGNCEVITNGKEIVGMIYSTSANSFRIYTKEEVIDLYHKGGFEKVTVTSVAPNPYGIVPVSVFYDTKIPRSGIWVQPDMDLVAANESYNLHLTDSDFSMKWAKLPTLFLIDCEISASGTERVQEVLEFGDKLTTTVPAQPDVTGGPSSVIHLQSNGSGTPSVQYIGPAVAIQPIDEVYEGWVKSIAADWSVRIKMSGEGAAQSGFQLVVEELPNLELKSMRQKMWASGFKRAWPVLRKVLNVSGDQVFSESTVMFVEFPTPTLPVDHGQQEDVWTKRIDAGRATVIDYFMIELSMTKEEAESKYAEIVRFNLTKDAISASNTDPVE